MTRELDQHELPPLVFLGQPALMRPQEPVTKRALASLDFQHQLQVLAKCMQHYGGIGIAAPQIGWNARVFCIGIDDDSARYPGAAPIPFEYWINPQIKTSSDSRNWAWEGCLSVPGMRGWVQRPAEVIATGLDENGASKERVFDGFAARVFQHEFDHLDGILYTSRVHNSGWLVPDASMAEQSDWPADWPSTGARTTGPGELSAAC